MASDLVLRSTPDYAKTDVRVFLDSEPEAYDVVLYDLPGTMNTNGVLYTISQLNYLRGGVQKMLKAGTNKC